MPNEALTHLRAARSALVAEAEEAQRRVAQLDAMIAHLAGTASVTPITRADRTRAGSVSRSSRVSQDQRVLEFVKERFPAIVSYDEMHDALNIPRSSLRGVVARLKLNGHITGDYGKFTYAEGTESPSTQLSEATPIAGQVTF